MTIVVIGALRANRGVILILSGLNSRILHTCTCIYNIYSLVSIHGKCSWEWPAGIAFQKLVMSHYLSVHMQGKIVIFLTRNILLKNLFLFVLRFYGPVNPIGLC